MTWWPGPRVPYVPVPEDPCPVCELVRGRAGNQVVRRDRLAVTYLARPPAVPGHLVVAPVRHVGSVLDLPVSDYTALHLRVYESVTALAAVVPTDRLLQLSGGVGHLRWELIPAPPGAPPDLAVLDLPALGALDLPSDQEAEIAAALRARLA